MRSYNNCLMKNEGGVRQVKQIQGTGTDFYNQEVAMSQIELEQKCIHLQTVLMLTQLNSAYFEIQLSLHRVFSSLEGKYFSNKMAAFLRISTQKRNIYERRDRFKFNNLRKNQEQNGERPVIKSRIRQILISDDQQSNKYGVFLKIGIILRKLCNKLQGKKANQIYRAFNQIKNYRRQASVIEILTQKHSKIKRQVNSKEKREYRGLYSSSKTKAHYQILPRQIHFQNINICKDEVNSKDYSQLNKLLQKNIDLNDRLVKQEISKSRKTFRSISRCKQNKSTIDSRKHQKIIQLQFLRQKYHRLIIQFNSFSDKFQLVIQEQQVK